MPIILALAVAAGLSDLSLVVTSDETRGRRAKFARHLLDLLGRADVPVVAGRELGRHDHRAAGELFPDDLPSAPTDVVATVTAVLRSTSDPVLWIGTGPMSNLADILATIQDREQLIVTQAGGLHGLFTDRAEPTLGADPSSASLTVVSDEVRARNNGAKPPWTGWGATRGTRPAVPALPRC